MSRAKRQIDGIKSLPSNAKFVGNGMKQDEWDSAMVWSPERPEVADDVTVVDTHEADGTAPAVTAGGLEDKNSEVAGWTKYELER